MPKPIILPDQPENTNLKSITGWLFEYELKRAVREMGRELKDLPFLTPFNRDRLARIFYGNEKHGIKKAQYKPEELAYFSRLMDWGRPASSLNRFFNYVFIATGKPKTEYEVDLEGRLGRLVTYMRGQIPRMIHEDAVKLQELLASIEITDNGHNYPEVDFVIESTKS